MVHVSGISFDTISLRCIPYASLIGLWSQQTVIDKRIFYQKIQINV